MVKYSEEIDIRGHYTDLEGRLIMKSLCDLFNDVANVQTYALKIDVPTLNEQGLTWMLHKLHILINRMPEQGENVTLETWPSGIDRLFAIRDFRMVAGEEVLLRATSEWMVIDVNRRRPVRLPGLRDGDRRFLRGWYSGNSFRVGYEKNADRLRKHPSFHGNIR